MLSKKHVEFHPIVFDQQASSVPPLVYIKCLSRNSIDVQKRSEDSDRPTKLKLSYKSAPYLLNQGDVVLISPVLHARLDLYHSNNDAVTARQRKELKVGQSTDFWNSLDVFYSRYAATTQSRNSSLAPAPMVRSWHPCTLLRIDRWLAK